MYKQTEPIRCPKCGAIVKVDLIQSLLYENESKQKQLDEQNNKE